MSRPGAMEAANPEAEAAKLRALNNDYLVRIAELEKDMSKLMTSKSMDTSQVADYLGKQRFIQELQTELRDAHEELSQLRTLFATQNHSLMSSLTEDDSEADLEAHKSRVAIDISKKFAKQQTYLAEFKSRNSDLERQLAMATAENAQLVIENCELKKQVRNLNGDESVNGAERQRLQTTIEELQRQLTIQKKTNDKSQASIAQMKSHIVELKDCHGREILSVNAEKNGASTELARIKAAYERVQTEASQSGREKDEAISKIQAIERENDELRAKIEAVNGEMKSVTSRFEQSNASVMDQISTKEQENDSLRAKLERTSELTQAEIEKLRRQHKDIELQVKKKERENADVTAELERSVGENVESKRQIDRLTTENTKINSQLRDRERENQDLRDKLERDRNEHELALAELRKEMKHFGSQIRKKEFENQTLQSELDDLRMARNSSKVEFERLAKEKEDNVAQVRRKQQELVQQKQDIEKAHLKIAKTRQKLVSLERETSVHSFKVMDTEAMLQDVRSQLSNTKDELDEQRTITHELTKRSENLEAKLRETEASNTDLSRSIIEDRRRRAASVAKTQEFKSQVRTLRDELQSLKKLAQKSTVLESEVRQKQKEYEAMKRQFDDVSEHNRSLVRQLEAVRETSFTNQERLNQADRESKRTQRLCRQIRIEHEREIENARDRIRQTASYCVRKCRALHAQYTHSLEQMDERIEQLRSTTSALVSMFRENKLAKINFSGERTRFLEQIERHLRVIDRITEVAADAAQLSLEKVPQATDLINKPKRLHVFLRRLHNAGHMNRGCCHRELDVQSFLESSRM